VFRLVLVRGRASCRYYGADRLIAAVRPMHHLVTSLIMMKMMIMTMK